MSGTQYIGEAFVGGVSSEFYGDPYELIAGTVEFEDPIRLGCTLLDVLSVTGMADVYTYPYELIAGTVIIEQTIELTCTMLEVKYEDI